MKQTPLFDAHVALGARMVGFGGWAMPVVYSSIKQEVEATRKAAALYDISHMGEFDLRGPDAEQVLQRLITNDLTRLPSGKAFYAALCREEGGTVDDLFVYRFSDNAFMLVVNAANCEKDFAWIASHIGQAEADLIDLSDATAKLDLQGPKSQAILQNLIDFDLDELGRFEFGHGVVAGFRVALSRTGYTGEDGFELYCASEEATALWDALLEAGAPSGLIPAGLGARDVLRLEACYSLYGHELSDTISPIEAGIGFAVRFDKGDFVGREALLAQKENPARRHMIAFQLTERGVPRDGCPVLIEGKPAGIVTSGTFSPTFEAGIGLALLDGSPPEVGAPIAIDIRGRAVAAKVMKRPLYTYRQGEQQP
ncbi:MAG: glycine cleavage system protein T [Alphaproteobacteria bacterium CG_4_10_14_0_2_um_filter_63_37]|nr:MAG: glycine cleavage system protein T [Alphaproteobacteria bacterium CG_4_10_14_0_2_um_filter_63_37]